MTFPTEPVTVPAEVTAIAAGRPARAVWVNELGGVTFSIADGTEYVKVYPQEHAGLLVAEAQRLTWARRYVSVPDDAYGVTADTERIAYYRRSWD